MLEGDLFRVVEGRWDTFRGRWGSLGLVGRHIWGCWGSLGVIEGRWETFGDHWGPLGIIEWGEILWVVGDHWGRSGLLGEIWGVVGAH